eukprot:TRINITY_DN3957_c0_g1_i1.p1 TRINITY_DN3957_c0_g1~~TRINITY_DN3957_c0_g1_i1.p1  ORF type:complete len:582 (-),score=159.74 TRINITY_DN3957_c0_g1_i1:120-1865(-)
MDTKSASTIIPGEVIVQRVFRGIQYSISCSLLAGGDKLVMNLEQIDNCDMWNAEFPSTYVEEITTKTGSYKRFDVFVRMLHRALTSGDKGDGTISLDLLTSADLEALRSKRKSELGHDVVTSPSKGASSRRPLNRRYLILTYSSEFDKIHYPLPLSFDAHPDPEKLKLKIVSLRNELHRCKMGMEGVSSDGRGDEGAGLNLSQNEDQLGKVLAENLKLREENEKLMEAYEALQKGSEVQMKRVDRESASLAHELELRGEELDMLREQISQGMKDGNKENRLIRKQLRRVQDELQAERESHRRVLLKKKHELGIALEAVEELRAIDKKQKQKIRQLTKDADAWKKRSLAGSYSRPTRSSSLKRGSSLEPEARRKSRLGRSSSVSSINSDASSSHGGSRSRTRTQSRIRAVPSTAGHRDLSRPQSRSGSRTRTRTRTRSRSRSSSFPRFDPTAWVREKEEKLKEIKRSGVVSRDPSPRRLSHSSSRSRSSSRERSRNPPSATSSPARLSKKPLLGERDRSRTPSRLRSTEDHSRRVSASYGRPSSSGKRGDVESATAEITDIDARLNALQAFLQETKRKHKGL